jgi:oxaloacetate decarboxylase alpha subunit
MFAQVGWKFLVNRGNAAAFEAAPDALAFMAETHVVKSLTVNPVTETYIINVDGRNFNVTVGPPGAPLAIKSTIVDNTTIEPIVESGAEVYAPMAGNILKILVEVGSTVVEGEVVVIMEAMKMETEVRSKFSGIVSAIHIKEGGAVAGGNALVSL